MNKPIVSEPWAEMLTEQQRSGVYKITLRGRLYVGSALNIGARWKAHLNDLARNKHHSRLLQRTFNKHGMTEAKFEVLEYVEDSNDLIPREQFWLDLLRPYVGGYNTCLVAGSVRGIKHPEESRLKMSATRKGRGIGKTLSPEHRAKIAKSLSGKPHTSERRAALSLAHLGISQSPEARAKISSALKGVMKSAETRKNMAVAQRKAWAERKKAQS